MLNLTKNIIREERHIKKFLKVSYPTGKEKVEI
jgi:hypothetical protein